jgi:pSer/pThr/pTyr-binding forkhead associated (FHA) protein
VFLDDVTVSRKHAEIRREADGFLIQDLGSLNGTYVNGERVERALLTSGDEIQIGKFKLTFFAAGE